MARRRFFVDSVRGGRAVLAGDQARHLRQVLRVEAGQRYEISDNQSLYLAEIESLAAGAVAFRVLEPIESAPAHVRPHLYLALVKFDRFEWAVEKATELGVDRIVPVAAERSEKGLERAARNRVERWRRVARESAQQARRARLPEIAEPAPFQTVLGAPGLHYFLDEQPGAIPLLSALPQQRRAGDVVSLLVGPEGGWTEAERALAAESGWTLCGLGPTVLRAETAAAASLAIVSAAWLARV